MLARLALCGLLGVTGEPVAVPLRPGAHHRCQRDDSRHHRPGLHRARLAAAGARAAVRSSSCGGIGLAAAGAIYLVGPERLSFAPGVALGNLLILLGHGRATPRTSCFSKPLVASPRSGHGQHLRHALRRAGRAAIAVSRRCWAADLGRSRPLTWLPGRLHRDRSRRSSPTSSICGRCGACPPIPWPASSICSRCWRRRRAAGAARGVARPGAPWWPGSPSSRAWRWSSGPKRCCQQPGRQPRAGRGRIGWCVHVAGLPVVYRGRTQPETPVIPNRRLDHAG